MILQTHPLPGRIWSLWDMLELDAGIFVHNFKGLCTAHQMMAVLLDVRHPIKIPPRSWADIQERVNMFRGIAADLNLPGTRNCANDSSIELDRVVPDAQGDFVLDREQAIRVESSLRQITDTARMESRGRKFLALNDTDLARWESALPPFGAKVAGAFSSANYDIEEAGKCLAVGRSTASAFHLVRVLEVALRAVRACLGVTQPLEGNEKNWGTILQRIRDVKTAKGNAWPEKLAFDEIYAFLDAVKGRWRNPTMHVEEKYTEDEARRLFDAIRNFMERLADRMDENGDPKA